MPPTPPYTEEWLQGPSSTAFYTRTYTAPNACAVLVFIHGAPEHAGRFTGMHTALSHAENGVSVFVLDLRGYGRTATDVENRSKDSRYGRTDWKRQLEDTEWAVEIAHAKFPDLPLFLMGSSMGGTIVLGLACDVSRRSCKAMSLVSGIIVASPWVALTKQPSNILLFIVRNIVIPLLPWTSFVRRNKSKELSRNPVANAEYDADPLIRSPGTLSHVSEIMMEAQKLLATEYANWPVKLPVLFLHGTADESTSYAASKALFTKLVAEDKEMITYPGGCHELHNEPNGIREKSLGDVVAFVRNHV